MQEEPLQPEFMELNLKIEKLRLEIAELSHAHSWNRRGARLLPFLTALVSMLALVFAVQQFVAQQKTMSAAQERQAQADQFASERAFMQPVLARQMNLYFETSSTVAVLASTKNPKEKARALDDFARLYLGPLVLIESPEVSSQMKKVRACLERGNACAPQTLQGLSLELSSSLQADFFSGWKLSPKDYADRSINYAALRGAQSKGK